MLFSYSLLVISFDVM